MDNYFDEKCDECRGKGFVLVKNQRRTCPECEGAGYVYRKKLTHDEWFEKYGSREE